MWLESPANRLLLPRQSAWRLWTRGLLCALALGSVVSLAAAQSAGTGGPERPDTRPQFKGGIDVVALNVVVLNGHNQYVTGLTETDFAVYEDGIQQQISYFADAATPLDLAILLDTSASMTERLPLVREAATGFLRTLRGGDRGMVVAFHDRVDTLAPFSADQPSLMAAVNGLAAHGGTSLHNAIYITLKELAREGRGAKDVRRQAIVVLSDGQDTASTLDFEEVLDLAKRSNTSIFTILMPDGGSALRSSSRYYSTAQYAMKTLAFETGARTFRAEAAVDLAGVYGIIAEELAHQYALGYVPKNPREDGAFRRVVVRVPTDPTARPRSKIGYFAPRASRAALNGNPGLPTK